MERKYRLRSNADFQRTRHEGECWANRWVVLCVLRNDLDHNRYGFSVSKRVGKAVGRNLARRRMREIVRQRRPMLTSGWDMVFIARPSVANATFGEIAVAIDQLLDRSGLRTSFGSRGCRNNGESGW